MSVLDVVALVLAGGLGAFLLVTLLFPGRF